MKQGPNNQRDAPHKIKWHKLTCNGHCDGIQRLSNLIDRLAGEHATVVLRLDSELEHVARYLAAVRAVRCGHGPGERHATVYPDHGGWRECMDCTGQLH